MAQTTDGLLRPMASNEDYVAEKHPLIQGLTVVWAPCGCRWVGTREDSFLTPCLKEDCSFSWTEACKALSRLEAAKGPGVVIASESKAALEPQPASISSAATETEV